MKNFSDFTKKIKSNKKLFYAINFLLILIVLSQILKPQSSDKLIVQNKNTTEESSVLNTSDYIKNLEIKLEEILININGINQVKVMIYAKSTPKLIPLYDENLNNESNIEINEDGSKREILNESVQKKILINNDKTKVFEQYYEYPEIEGILVVADYEGNEKTKKYIIDSVKTLLHLKINKIEVIAAEKKEGGKLNDY